MRLSSFVRKVSKDAVVEGVRSIKRHQIPSGNIVAKRNPLILNANKAVIKHSNVTIPNYRLSQTKISTFLAASSLSHMLDGWMYLSNAFNAILNGDEGTAIHLSYYAELRSAMSILATEGIGVMNNKHIGIFSDGLNGEFPTNYFKGIPPTSYQIPKIPTHVFVWDAMEKWSNSAFKPDPDILNIFKVRGKNFYELTEYFHPSTAGSTLLSVKTVKDWLKEWCFDIKSYRNDRENRNEVSYRPQRIKDFNSYIDFQDIINKLNSFWSVISPITTDKFNLLDTYLLRKLYSSLFHSINDPSLVLKDQIENAFVQHGITDNTLFSFLNFENPHAGDHVIFQQASLRETTPLSIIARATLLLRISVGLVSSLYKAGGISKSELNFIWNNYGIDNGFWNAGNLPPNFNNLWIDVQTSLGDLISDVNTPGVDNSIFAILNRNPEEVGHLTQINRACLWGLDF